MTNQLLTQALAEAYASQPDDELVVDTLELHHPAFIDEFGQLSTVRVVNNTQNLMLGLEPDAPLNGGEMVLFRGVPYQIKAPDILKDSVPQLPITIPIVNRDLVRYVEQAISMVNPIIVYWRSYLLSDPSLPQQDPPIIMELSTAEIANGMLTGTASLNDVHNWPFPGKKYTRDRFRNL
jgi:hypothetical protein